MTDKCPVPEPAERYVAITFPDYVWRYLEKESEDTGNTISKIVSRIVADHVREEKGNCG